LALTSGESRHEDGDQSFGVGTDPVEVLRISAGEQTKFGAFTYGSEAAPTST
jgi:hypothetical protein